MWAARRRRSRLRRDLSCASQPSHCETQRACSGAAITSLHRLSKPYKCRLAACSRRPASNCGASVLIVILLGGRKSPGRVGARGHRGAPHARAGSAPPAGARPLLGRPAAAHDAPRSDAARQRPAPLGSEAEGQVSQIPFQTPASGPDVKSQPSPASGASGFGQWAWSRCINQRARHTVILTCAASLPESSATHARCCDPFGVKQTSPRRLSSLVVFAWSVKATPSTSGLANPASTSPPWQLARASRGSAVRSVYGFVTN